MRTRVVSIGNSRGIRIPAVFLREAGLGDEVELTLSGAGLAITPIAPHPREGWAEAIAAATEEDLIDVFPYVDTEADLEEWTWPEEL